MNKKHEVLFPNLVSEMARRGENQKTLASLLGVTSATISRKLAGKIDWSIGEIDIICEHYKKDYYQLFK